MHTMIKATLGTMLVCFASALAAEAGRAAQTLRLDALVGQPADVASSAYAYRADRPAGENPPEGWLLLMQHANLPFDKPVDVHAPAIKRVLCGLLWEEVRQVRAVELSWPADAKNRPAPDEVSLAYFDATDENAHTWWNPRTIKEAGAPEVKAEGGVARYRYTIPADTWGVVAVVREPKDASALAVPAVRAFVPDTWKRMDLEIEWGEDARATLDGDCRVEAYDGIIGDVRPLAGGRRGVELSLLYIGSSRWRRVWPYHAQPEDAARTILTVSTGSGTASFLASDLEQGPILAPEYGFFLRRTSGSAATAATAGTPPKVPAPPQSVLAETMDAIPGVPKIRGWARDVIPWFGVNPDREPGAAGNLRIPARGVAMHPLPTRDVAVGWRSPIAGRVRVEGRTAMGDAAGGNGIVWSVALESAAGWQILAHGAIDTGGGRAIPAGADARKLGDVAVAQGDTLSLVVGAKNGDHICDTTIIEFTIAEVGGRARVWNLAADVVDTVHAGNPHADGFGNPGVWRFYALDAPLAAPPAPSEPPFSLESTATTALEFVRELAARGLSTIRQRVRTHPEQTWEGAVAAMHGGTALPPIPKPEFEPPMQVDVPCERLTAQWKLGAWHILRRSVKDQNGKWHINDFPFGILASETYMILRALDLQGMHREAADGLDQWLSLPMSPTVVPGQGGHHGWALADRPLGHFSDGAGCLTHAEGPPGAGGHMDGVHCMGPGAIMFTLIEHFHLTGDLAWLKAHAPRMKANAEWILRQRRLLAGIVPGGERLWSKGLQPAHVVTPDSFCMRMQYYESEAYYWLAVKRMAELLALIDPAEGAAMAAEAKAYRADLLAAIDRSIALSPVVPVRDGTYRSFIPFSPYVRGFAAGAWGWRRCQGHVGAIYWDTVQSADPLISPAGLLSPLDPRVQGHLDVLEDRLLLENTKVRERTRGFDPEKDWFSHASWQYQCGLERHANIHLAADDAPNVIRSVLNQYAVDIMPGEYTFREHTTGGPPDKIYEESCFLERFRQMLVMEVGDSLWLARAAPRAWFAQGKRIAVKRAPTHFGAVAYEITSDVDNGTIAATVEMPSRAPPKAVVLRLRHPAAAPIERVTVNGRPWDDFDREKEIVNLRGLKGPVAVEVAYRAR